MASLSESIEPQPFSSQQIAFFEENGYLSGPRVFSDDQVDELKSRIDDLITGRVDFPQHLKAGGDLASAKIVNLYRHDAVFAAIDHTPMGTLANDLMTAPVRLWEDQMIMKVPHEGDAALAWHQDCAFWDYVAPAELVTCWIALDDAAVANGCMHVVPGSHRWDLDYHRDELPADDPDWLLNHPDIPAGACVEPVPCEVKAGHCHFHHCRTLHGSYGSTTASLRRSYVLHLLPGNTRRIGQPWNSRMAQMHDIADGALVEGPDFPVLPCSASV
tara:strand:- start:486 stop:1304 length:819 start_codon:yes stop_codon:yes gene_type:complete